MIGRVRKFSSNGGESLVSDVGCWRGRDSTKHCDREDVASCEKMGEIRGVASNGGGYHY